MRTTFYIEKMDCSAEEQMVRMRFADLVGIQYLEFNLPERTVTVYHVDSRGEIGSALVGLGLGMEETEHEEGRPYRLRYEISQQRKNRL